MPRRKNDTNRTPARDINAGLRAAQALNLRKLGATYDTIAQQCSYGNRGTAYNAVQRELQRTLQENADELRTLLAQRLDDLYRVMVAKALKGDHWAVDRCLQIIDRQDRLFNVAVKPDTSQQQAQMIVIGVPQDVLEAV